MKILTLAKRAREAVLSLAFPPHCAACKADTSAGIHLCPSCEQSARRIEPPFCHVCSEPFYGAIDGRFTCPNCAERQFHFESAVARYLSRGVVRDCLHRFKYERHYYLRHQLANWLADAWQDERLRSPSVDYLVPVPLHNARRREREFNQADVLAELLSRRTGTRLLRCLRRIRYTTTQTQLDRHERMENLRGAFRVTQASRVQNRHLVLVDDVLTTGSTVDECARMLREAGAASIRVITVARG